MTTTMTENDRITRDEIIAIHGDILTDPFTLCSYAALSQAYSRLQEWEKSFQWRDYDPWTATHTGVEWSVTPDGEKAFSHLSFLFRAICLGLPVEDFPPLPKETRGKTVHNQKKGGGTSWELIIVRKKKIVARIFEPKEPSSLKWFRSLEKYFASCGKVAVEV